MEVEVADVPLITRLGPATLRCAAGFDVLHFAIGDDPSRGKDENVCGIRVGDDGGVSWGLGFEPRKRVQVRTIANVKRVLGDRSRRLNRFEQLSCRTGEYRDGVGRRSELVFEKTRDAFDVLVETRPFGRVRRVSAASRLQLLAGECLMLVAAVLIGSRIQIEADDGVGSR